MQMPSGCLRGRERLRPGPGTLWWRRRRHRWARSWHCDRPAPGALTHRLRNYLLAGIVVSAPITITLFIVWQVLGYVDRTVTPFIPTAYNPETYLPFGLPGIGLADHAGPADPDRLGGRRAWSAPP